MERPKPVDRGAKIRELLELHAPVFEALGVTKASYMPKMFYTPSGKEGLHLSFFISELQRGQDIYTEMVDRDYNSEDTNRTLYKWSFNPNWDSAYDRTDKEPIRVLVPASELVKIDPEKVLGAPLPADGCTEDDCEIGSMTLRDLAAVMLKAPVSHKEWLNDIINTHKE